MKKLFVFIILLIGLSIRSAENKQDQQMFKISDTCLIKVKDFPETFVKLAKSFLDFDELKKLTFYIGNKLTVDNYEDPNFNNYSINLKYLLELFIKYYKICCLAPTSLYAKKIIKEKIYGILFQYLSENKKIGPYEFVLCQNCWKFHPYGILKHIKMFDLISSD